MIGIINQKEPYASPLPPSRYTTHTTHPRCEGSTTHPPQSSPRRVRVSSTAELHRKRARVWWEGEGREGKGREGRGGRSHNLLFVFFLFFFSSQGKRRKIRWDMEPEGTSTDERVWCHDCRASFGVPAAALALDDPQCPHCNGSFIEFLDEEDAAAAAAAAQVTAARSTSATTSTSTTTTTGGGGGGGGGGAGAGAAGAGEGAGGTGGGNSQQNMNIQLGDDAQPDDVMRATRQILQHLSMGPTTMVDLTGPGGPVGTAVSIHVSFCVARTRARRVRRVIRAGKSTSKRERDALYYSSRFCCPVLFAASYYARGGGGACVQSVRRLWWEAGKNEKKNIKKYAEDTRV